MTYNNSVEYLLMGIMYMVVDSLRLMKERYYVYPSSINVPKHFAVVFYSKGKEFRIVKFIKLKESEIKEWLESKKQKLVKSNDIKIDLIKEVRIS